MSTTYFGSTPIYRVEFGDPRLSLDKLLSDDAKKVAESAAVAAIEAYQAQREGSAFPSTPVTGDRFFRADLGGWFYWTGSLWLSTAIHPITVRTDWALPLTITGTARAAIDALLLGGTDVYIESIFTSFHVQGGSALSGSHKWVGTSGSTTININSGASDTWRSNVSAIGALVGSVNVYQIGWTKTGTPGDLFVFSELICRVVAT